MGKENFQSQASQKIDSQGLQVLENLRKLNNLQEEDDKEKLRTLGLQGLYSQMADPPLEFIEKATNIFISMPYDDFFQLFKDTANIVENPSGFAFLHGIKGEDGERIKAGISNTERFLLKMMGIYDSRIGRFDLDDEFAVQDYCKKIFEIIQSDNRERQIDGVVEEIRNETDLKRRYLLGLDLKDQVLDHIEKSAFSISGRQSKKDEPRESTWEYLANNSYISFEHQKEGEKLFPASLTIETGINTAQAAITRFQLETRLQQLPSKDRQRFKQLRFKYGAKAANLMLLSEQVTAINGACRDFLKMELTVPDFKAIPVDCYRAWQEGRLSDDDLKSYFNFVKELETKDKGYPGKEKKAKYIVRSSAVFSEDGEEVTGGGIYESVVVQGGGSFQDFKEAITKVYQSTESPKAQAYRQEYGIEKEEMGLVVQEFIDLGQTTKDNDYWEKHIGYLNTRLNKVPKLLEIVTGTSRNFVRRNELDFFLALNTYRSESAFETVHHFPPDSFKTDPDMIVNLAQYAAIVERIWNRAIQVEFVANGPDINFVQVRELPVKSTIQEKEVQFPDVKPIHTGASIGIGDIELPVLNESGNNSEEKGVVVFNSSFGWSEEGKWIQLPKEGAVIICEKDTGNGHIQTLCSERELICIFPDVNDDNKISFQDQELTKFKKVRVISNGIEGRVYKG